MNIGKATKTLGTVAGFVIAPLAIAFFVLKKKGIKITTDIRADDIKEGVKGAVNDVVDHAAATVEQFTGTAATPGDPVDGSVKI